MIHVHLPAQVKGRIGLVALLLALRAAVAADTQTVRIPRVTTPPRLENYLDGGSRDAEVKITGFVQRDPADGSPASELTTAYLSYDDKNLYVIFVCRAAPGTVRATLGRRENVSGDDVVGIILDTFHDRRHSFGFLANPYGIQIDFLTTEGQNDDDSFETLWYSDGRVTSDGFVVWMALPFRSLRFRAESKQTWGFAVLRSVNVKNELSFWPHISRKVEGFHQQLATLEGLEDISPGRNLQFIPYGAFGASRFLDAAAPGGARFRRENDGRAGLDSKIVLRDALALDLTLNPDFSQVESDEPQVTVNQRFEVFFPERRPFFIENPGYFQTPENLFFSRRIADPQFGARLTGKLGKWAVGALVADDRAPGRRADEALRGGRAVIGVARVQREISKQSTVAVMATTRDFASSFNRIVSLDARLKLNANWVFTGQAARSYTSELGGGRRSGPLYATNLGHSGAHTSFSTRYTDRSPDFHTDLGFIPRVDVREWSNEASYRWKPAGRRLLTHGPFANFMLNWERSGRLQDRRFNLGYTADFPRNTYVIAVYYRNYELFHRVGLHPHGTGVLFNTEWVKWLAVNAGADYGVGLNYEPARGLAPFEGRYFNGSAEIRIRPTVRLRIDERYIYTRLASLDSHGVIFTNHLWRTKVNYQFTRRLSLRAIGDFQSVLPNESLIRQERSKRLAGDVLLTYLINPGTALYLGYTDRRENLALFGSGLDAEVRRIRSPDTVTGRQFFAKISYLFRF